MHEASKPENSDLSLDVYLSGIVKMVHIITENHKNPIIIVQNFLDGIDIINSLVNLIHSCLKSNPELIKDKEIINLPSAITEFYRSIIIRNQEICPKLSRKSDEVKIRTIKKMSELRYLFNLVYYEIRDTKELHTLNSWGGCLPNMIFFSLRMEHLLTGAISKDSFIQEAIGVVENAIDIYQSMDQEIEGYIKMTLISLIIFLITEVIPMILSSDLNINIPGNGGKEEHTKKVYKMITSTDHDELLDLLEEHLGVY